MQRKLVLSQKEIVQIRDLLDQKYKSLDKELSEKQFSMTILNVVQQEMLELSKTIVYLDSLTDRE